MGGVCLYQIEYIGGQIPRWILAYALFFFFFFFGLVYSIDLSKSVKFINHFQKHNSGVPVVSQQYRTLTIIHEDLCSLEFLLWLSG